MTPSVHATILLKVAKKTRDEARRAWPRDGEDNVESLRSAYHACMLAARCARRAAEAWKHNAPLVKKLEETAAKLDEASDELLTRLALSKHWTPPPAVPTP